MAAPDDKGDWKYQDLAATTKNGNSISQMERLVVQYSRLIHYIMRVCMNYRSLTYNYQQACLPFNRRSPRWSSGKVVGRNNTCARGRRFPA